MSPRLTIASPKMQSLICLPFTCIYIMNLKSDEVVKIMLVGDSNVGKTSILKAFTQPNKQHSRKVKSTVGLDYGQRLFNLKGKEVLVQIWDTAGQQRFQTLTPSYYRSAMGIFLVFSVTDKSSFNSIQLWMRQIRQYAMEDVPVLILCNKIDIVTREVSEAQCKALELRHNVKTLNTSVVSNLNIGDAVTALYQAISEQKKIKPKDSSSLQLTEPSKRQSGSCSC